MFATFNAMASTVRVELDLDDVALWLARRAAEIEGMSLSRYVSQQLRRHAWDCEPISTPENRAAAELAAKLDLIEFDLACAEVADQERLQSLDGQNGGADHTQSDDEPPSPA